ncbi:hypothetical protein [uncultured Bacteroides sp.]|uniref:hypothetical protein n=1 Tax=uncultured Bacteroides sp. TaxID=162156 RepID=UPI002AAABB66|nr:hypothetical protein [uncultured Bacteroides sp.]
MLTTKKLTPAEKTLDIISKLVLVLGTITSIYIPLSFAWITKDVNPYSYSTQVSSFDWYAILVFIYCIIGTLTIWAILSILVQISVNSRKEEVIPYSWKKDFAVAIALEQTAKAKEILYREIFQSEEYKNVLSKGDDAYNKKCIDHLNETYAFYLKQIGEESFKYTEANTLFSVFK